MAFQQVSIILNLSDEGDVLDFCIERTDKLKSELQEVPIIKAQRIECEKCRNELELCLWLQKSFIVEKIDQESASVKDEPRLQLSDSEWFNDFEPPLDVEDKPEVVTQMPISVEGKPSRKKREKKIATKESKDVPIPEKLKCSQCTMTFQNKRAILTHIRHKHSETRKEPRPDKEICHLCGRNVPRKQFQYHLSSHSDDNYECNICHKKFKIKTNIYNHMKLAHLENANVKVCPFCGKRFLQEAKLVEHVARHENQRQFKCDLCSQDFNTQRAVDLHKVKIHQIGERKKLFCQVCGHVSYNKSGYDKHQVIHMNDNEKPFQCPHCPKGFSGKWNFDRHVMVHTGEKPLKCEVCFKGFRELWALRSHMRKHTGEKPYECSLEGCKKKFSDRNCYRIHLKIHEKRLNIQLDKSTRKFVLNVPKVSRLSQLNDF